MILFLHLSSQWNDLSALYCTIQYFYPAFCLGLPILPDILFGIANLTRIMFRIANFIEYSVQDCQLYRVFCSRLTTLSSILFRIANFIEYSVQDCQLYPVFCSGLPTLSSILFRIANFTHFSVQDCQADDVQLPGGEAGCGHHLAPPRNLEFCPGKIAREARNEIGFTLHRSCICSLLQRKIL